MPFKKHYPDQEKIRIQARIACKAVQILAELGVEVVSVTFRHPHPLIEVMHCPGTNNLRNHYKGQGEDNSGNKYTHKVAHINGCQIEWNEDRK
ncbi:MAG: hypothetical protein DRQ62_04030 [Gammaproteobacteria bacterium]|nr:MAG: hypothetical protein DRQ62_04030 [Gammaproteobacteria bacterium]